MTLIIFDFVRNRTTISETTVYNEIILENR